MNKIDQIKFILQLQIADADVDTVENSKHKNQVGGTKSKKILVEFDGLRGESYAKKGSFNLYIFANSYDDLEALEKSVFELDYKSLSENTYVKKTEDLYLYPIDDKETIVDANWLVTVANEGTTARQGVHGTPPAYYHVILFSLSALKPTDFIREIYLELVPSENSVHELTRQIITLFYTNKSSIVQSETIVPDPLKRKEKQYSSPNSLTAGTKISQDVRSLVEGIKSYGDNFILVHTEGYGEYSTEATTWYQQNNGNALTLHPRLRIKGHDEDFPEYIEVLSSSLENASKNLMKKINIQALWV